MSVYTDRKRAEILAELTAESQAKGVRRAKAAALVAQITGASTGAGAANTTPGTQATGRTSRSTPAYDRG